MHGRRWNDFFFRIREGELEIYDSIFYASGVGFNAGHGARGIFRFTCFQIDLPGMQWADDEIARYDAIGKRASLMRAPIFRGEKSISKIEQGNLAAFDENRPAFPDRDGLLPSDTQPFRFGAHGFTPSMG
jgi:hypothetical protein